MTDPNHVADLERAGAALGRLLEGVEAQSNPALEEAVTGAWVQIIKTIAELRTGT